MEYLNENEENIIEYKDLFWNKDFVENLNSPLLWKFKADELKKSADVLWRNISESFDKTSRIMEDKNISIACSLSIISVFVMISGFAIENLLKGLYINQNHISIVNGKTKPKLNHDLVDISKKLKLEFDDAQLKMLDKLTRHILWEGRYPCSSNEFKFEYPRTKSNIDKWPGVFVPEFDVPIINSIFDKLYSEYEKLEGY